MKMAKADGDDIKLATEIAAALDCLTYQWGPTFPRLGVAPADIEEDSAEDFDCDNAEHCKRALNELLRFAGSGSGLWRVVGGISTLLDPRNEVVDPDLGHIEHHPKTLAGRKALEEVEKLRAAAAIEFEPGRVKPLDQLVRNVVRGIKVRRKGMLWPRVVEVFAVGSTVACAICRWAGRDPDTGAEING